MFDWLFTRSNPAQQDARRPVDVAREYLRRFGYLAADGALAGAVALFRKRFGLEDGGHVDDAVLRAMRLPRCGLPDHRLASENARWRKRDLGVYVESYVTSLSRSDQDDMLDGCLKAWPAVAEVKLRRVTSRTGADVIIGAGRGRANGFDGQFGTLAWAELPPGDDRPLRMMLDLDEQWIRDARLAGILYPNVVDHELGHILGLDHSSRRMALMFANYSGGIAVPQQDDDIPRIQALYGPPVTQPPPPQPQGRTRLVLDFAGPIPEYVVRKETG